MSHTIRQETEPIRTTSPCPCRRCGVAFVGTPSQRYCETCMQERLHRPCAAGCGTIIKLSCYADPRQFCSEECRWKERHDKGTEAVRCRWPTCPRPDDLIIRHKSRGDRQPYHPECGDAYRSSSGPRKGTGKGTVVYCQECEDEIGYRTPSAMGQKYHWECYKKLGLIGHRPLKGEMRRCAVCPKEVYRQPSQLARGKNVYCSVECHHAWQREHKRQNVDHLYVSVRCTTCDHTRRMRRRGLRPTVDPATLTWTCPTCRPHQWAVVTGVCEYCTRTYSKSVSQPDRYNARFCDNVCRRAWMRENQVIWPVCPYCQKLEAKRPRSDRDYERAKFRMPRSQKRFGRLHFCSRQHNGLYYHEKRQRKNICGHCRQVIKRKGDNAKFCDVNCYAAWKRGRSIPTPRTSAGEQRLEDSWERGIQGIRALASDSKTSHHTVRRWLIQTQRHSST